MGTINERPRKDGTIAFTAQIAIMRNGKSHREAKTFDRRSAAAAWIKTRETALGKPGALENAEQLKQTWQRPTLCQAIDRYIAETNKSLGKTKTQVLHAIKAFDIAEKECSKITSVDIVEFANQKLASGVKPQTVGNYMSHLGSIFSIARPAWGYELDARAMEDAWKVTKSMRITKKSDQRNRRPDLHELDLLMNHFGERSHRRPTCVPMQRIIAFGLFSTRRQEEIIRMRWSDLDSEGKRILVRDMKNPGEKIGNDVWCDLPDEALMIIRAMPMISNEIFPFKTDAISAAFTRACRLLGIEDLHFHDLRHDGVSRLFEMGLNIPHVAAVSGHRSWNSLKRYTHLRQTGDKYIGWKWLPTVTSISTHCTVARLAP